MTTDSFQDKAGQFFQHADRMLRAAELMVLHDLPESAVDRAYYTMFHAAAAVISLQSAQEPKSHAGLSNLFALHVVRSGLVGSAQNKVLSDALRLRLNASYNPNTVVTSEAAMESVATARAFLALMRQVADMPHIGALPHQSEE